MIIITSNHLTHPGIHFNKMPTYGQHSETTALKCKDWRPVGPPGYGCKGYLLDNNLFLLYLFIEQQHLFLSYCIYLLNNTISSCCIYLLNHTSSYCVYLLNNTTSSYCVYLQNTTTCPQKCRCLAYIILIRSSPEYGATVRDPYLKQDVDRLERVQCQAAHFIKRDYRTRDRMHGTHAPWAKPATIAGTKEAATADSPLQDCEGPHPRHASRERPDAGR